MQFLITSLILILCSRYILLLIFAPLLAPLNLPPGTPFRTSLVALLYGLTLSTLVFLFFYAIFSSLL